VKFPRPTHQRPPGRTVRQRRSQESAARSSVAGFYRLVAGGHHELPTRQAFSVDNYKSLTIDSVCREDGCAKLGIQPQPMLAVLPTYLGIQSAPEQLDYFQRINDRYALSGCAMQRQRSLRQGRISHP
jgi:hypothetical protein